MVVFQNYVEEEIVLFGACSVGVREKRNGLQGLVFD